MDLLLPTLASRDYFDGSKVAGTLKCTPVEKREEQHGSAGIETP
jgi:hypothetical protein